jgi:hypothetical protein
MTRDKITPKRGGPRVPCRAPRGVPRAVSSIPGIMIHLCRITAGASPHSAADTHTPSVGSGAKNGGGGGYTRLTARLAGPSRLRQAR